MNEYEIAVTRITVYKIEAHNPDQAWDQILDNSSDAKIVDETTIEVVIHQIGSVQ